MRNMKYVPFLLTSPDECFSSFLSTFEDYSRLYFNEMKECLLSDEFQSHQVRKQMEPISCSLKIHSRSPPPVY